MKLKVNFPTLSLLSFAILLSVLTTVLVGISGGIIIIIAYLMICQKKGYIELERENRFSAIKSAKEEYFRTISKGNEKDIKKAARTLKNVMDKYC